MSSPLSNLDFYQACLEGNIELVQDVVDGKVDLAWPGKEHWGEALKKCLTQGKDHRVSRLLIQKTPINFAQRHMVKSVVHQDLEIVQEVLHLFNSNPSFYKNPLDQMVSETFVLLTRPSSTPLPRVLENIHTIFQSPAIQKVRSDKQFQVWSFWVPDDADPFTKSIQTHADQDRDSLRQNWIDRLTPEDYVGLLATVGCSFVGSAHWGVWEAYLHQHDREHLMVHSPHYNPLQASPSSVLKKWTEALREAKPLSFWEEVLKHVDEACLSDQRRKVWDIAFPYFETWYSETQKHVLTQSLSAALATQPHTPVRKM